MKAAAYYRVSSKAQDLATQRHAVGRAARARGDRLVRTFEEKQSARTLDRPALGELRQAARAGELARLYVYKLDRLSRSGIYDMVSLLKELRAHGVEVVTVADGFDLAGPAAEVVIAVLAWAGEQERRAISERISAARERLKEEGRPWGRPPRMTPAELEKARRMAAAGDSARTIAVALSVPRSTIRRAIKRNEPTKG